jgi:hypothetical protein
MLKTNISTFIGVLLYLFIPYSSQYFSSFDYDSIRFYLFFIIIIILTIKIIIKKNITKYDFMFYFSFIFLYFTDNLSLLAIALFSYFIMISKDHLNILKFFWSVSLVLYFFLIFINLFGFNDVYSIIYSRNTLGFRNPNNPVYYYISIFTLYIFINHKDKKKVNNFLIFSILFTLFLIFSTKSLGAYVLLFFEIAILLSIKFKFKSNVIKILIKNSFIFFLIFSIILTFFSDNYLLNQLSNTRVEILSNYVNNSNLKLFGNGLYVIDSPILNSYIYLFYSVGIVFYIILNNVMKVFINSIKDEIHLFLTIALVLVYSLFENYIMHPSNPLFILIAVYFAYEIKSSKSVKYEY